MAFQTPITIVGGSSGRQDFSHYGGTDGKILEKIGIWAAESRIKAIRVWLTDDAPQTFGIASQPDGEGPLHYKEFAFESAELITRLSLWGNGAGTRMGWIYFETNRSRRFDFGMYSWGKKEEFPVDVGSGICVGVQGGAGSDVDRLGFVFLKPIAYSKLLNVQYPTLAFTTAGITAQTVKEFNTTNNTSSVTSWEFSGSTEVTTTSTWSVTTGLAVHASVSVEAGIPKVGKVAGEFGWTLSASVTGGTSSSNTDTMTWKFSGSLDPGKSIDLRAITGRGVISIPYTGSIEVTLKSGTTFQYPLTGQYSGVSYSGVTIT